MMKAIHTTEEKEEEKKKPGTFKWSANGMQKVSK